MHHVAKSQASGIHNLEDSQAYKNWHWWAQIRIPRNLGSIKPSIFGISSGIFLWGNRVTPSNETQKYLWPCFRNIIVFLTGGIQLRSMAQLRLFLLFRI